MTFSINFEKKGDITAAIFEVETNILALPDGKWTVSCRKPVRSQKQHGSYNLFARFAAVACKKEHVTMGISFFSLETDSYPSEEQIKENIFKPFMFKKWGKKSSTQLTTSEMAELAVVMERAFAMNGLDVKWPDKESKEFKEKYGEIKKEYDKIKA